ncbi:MAG: hypothetical protein H0T62_10820 [Parachlamydiaceae bacterium]|nr:hypothetical protein [Parachlamydiaceae bacterium]
MIHSEFSITYELLNALNDYDSKVGKFSSFFAVHLAGGATTAITLGLDTLLHLAACVVKVVTGIICTPLFYFTDSPGAENWTWSASGKHFVEAVKHAAGFLVVPPTTFFFSPDAALNLLFAEKVQLKRLQEELNSAQIKSEQEQMSPDDLQKQQLEEALEEENLSADDLHPKIGVKENEQLTIEGLLSQFEEERLRYSSEIEQLNVTLNNTKDEVIQLKKRSAVHVHSSDEDSNGGQEIIKTLHTMLDTANSTILSLELQLEDLNELRTESQNQIDDLKKQLNKVNEKTSNESLKQIRINDLETQLKQEENKYVELNQTLTWLREDDKNCIVDLEAQLKQVEEKASQKSQKQIKALKELSEKDHIQITDLKKQLQKVEDSWKQVNLERNSLATQLNEQENINDEQHKKLNEQKSILANQNLEITQLKLQKQSSIPDHLKIAIYDLDQALKCPIDLEYLSTAAFVVPCGHKFNAESLQKYLDKADTCPSCTKPITGSNIDHQTREIAEKVEAIQGIIQQALATI